MTPDIDTLRALIDILQFDEARPHLGDTIAYALFDGDEAYQMLPHVYGALRYVNPSVDDAIAFTKATLPNNEGVTVETLLNARGHPWALATVNACQDGKSQRFVAEGPDPAVALVLAALKAKLAEVEAGK